MSKLLTVKHAIVTTVEGSMGDVLTYATDTAKAPTLEDLLATMAGLAFVVETVAHLQGKEKELLPLADKARKQIAALETKTV